MIDETPVRAGALAPTWGNRTKPYMRGSESPLKLARPEASSRSRFDSGADRAAGRGARGQLGAKRLQILTDTLQAAQLLEQA